VVVTIAAKVAMVVTIAAMAAMVGSCLDTTFMANTIDTMDSYYSTRTKAPDLVMDHYTIWLPHIMVADLKSVQCLSPNHLFYQTDFHYSRLVSFPDCSLVVLYRI